MIQLSSEPVLSSMVITAGGVWDYTYRLPNGYTFDSSTESEVVVTDRAGAVLATFEPDSIEGRNIRYLVQPEDITECADGANFEMFITIDAGTYKVRYGRVVRREAVFPANPLSSTTYTGALYTDSVGLRNTLGPYWVQKSGKTVMHANTGGKPYGMGNDFILFDSSATHWYAPLKSDSQKVQVSLMKIGGGQAVVVLCSNYGMTNWIGIKFDCTANTVRPVTAGSTPVTWVDQASTVANTVAGTPDTYTVYYDYPTNTIKLFKGAGTTPLLSFTDSTNLCQHGEGHRYIGMIYKGALLSAGPEVSYWSAKDDL